MSPIRTASLVALVPLLACGPATIELGPSSDPLEDSSALFLTEGSFRGELVSAYTTGADELGLAGSGLIIVSELLERNGRIGSIDISARPGAGYWMMGRGHVNLEDDYSGPFHAEVSDGRDTHCELSGVWSTSEDLVDLTAECWDNGGRSADYEVIVARF